VLKPQFGIWINIPTSNNFSVRSELLFTQKAWLPSDVENAVGLDFNYLSIPLSLNYHLNNWRIAVGPEISFLINQSYSEDIPGVLNTKNPLVEEQKLELGIHTGIRYHFQRWQLGLRYNLDFTPFVSFEFTDINGEPVGEGTLDHYHHGLQLSMGYRL